MGPEYICANCWVSFQGQALIINSGCNSNRAAAALNRIPWANK
jgi:hypothetical protein